MIAIGLPAAPRRVVDARAGTLGAVADDSPHDELLPGALGPNAWLVDEMHEQYLADPTSVSESWQDFFADYRRDAAPQTMAAAAPAAARGAGSAPAPAAPSAAGRRPRRGAAAAEPVGEPIRGAAARIVTNMEASLEVPTATSFRSVPAKLLEVNRRVINGYLGRTRGGKVSFTHLIGFAVVRAIHESVPVMNSTLRGGRRGQAAGRPPRAREPRHRRRPREERREPHAARARRPRRRHARLPRRSGAPTRS